MMNQLLLWMLTNPDAVRMLFRPASSGGGGGGEEQQAPLTDTSGMTDPCMKAMYDVYHDVLGRDPTPEDVKKNRAGWCNKFAQREICKVAGGQNCPEKPPDGYRTTYDANYKYMYEQVSKGADAELAQRKGEQIQSAEVEHARKYSARQLGFAIAKALTEQPGQPAGIPTLSLRELALRSQSQIMPSALGLATQQPPFSVADPFGNLFGQFFGAANRFSEAAINAAGQRRSGFGSILGLISGILSTLAGLPWFPGGGKKKEEGGK